jgi:hypothetical protein
MVVLNTAAAIRLGTSTASAVYAGANKVWPSVPPSSVPPTFVGSSQGQITAATPLAIPPPPGAVVGDRLVIYFGGNGTPSATPRAIPVGWTLIQGGLHPSGTVLFAYTAVHDGSPSWTWTISGGGGRYVIAAYTPSTVSASSPVATGTGTAVTATGVTTTSPTRILYLGRSSGNSTWTTPAGFTMRQESGASPTTNTSHMADKEQLATGPTGNVIATCAVSGNWLSCLVALTGP